MIQVLIGFVFIALILLIMRISNLNVQVAHLDEQMSDLVTHDYLRSVLMMSKDRMTPEDMQAELDKMKKRLTNTELGSDKE